MKKVKSKKVKFVNEKVNQCVIGKEFCGGCDLFDGFECTRGQSEDCKRCLTCENFGMYECRRGWGDIVYVRKQTADN